MIAETLVALATVWYVPGWMRTKEPQRDVLPAMTNVYPHSEIKFQTWDGNRVVWPSAIEFADKESWRLAFEIATMPLEQRTNLVVVGHSLGGRIAARTLARLAEKNIRIRQAVLLAAAIPYDDPDLSLMGGGSQLPVMAICNPDDVTLRYVYTILGSEKTAAFGANGTLKPITNVVEYVVPSNITVQVELPYTWAKVQAFKDIANHFVLFYLDCLKDLLQGQTPSKEVMVPQHRVTLERKVIDAGIWWQVLDECRGWKLEQHKLTHHCRILDPSRTCTAWGGRTEMTASFAKVKAQVGK